MSKVLLVGTLIITLAVSISCFAQVNIGAGIKFIREVPFLAVNAVWGVFGAEAGMGMTSYGYLGYNMSLLWYLVNGKAYFSMPLLRPYLGAGVVGVNATVSALGQTASGSAMGVDVLAGLEFPFDTYGIPLTVFGGLDWLMFGNLTLSYPGQTIEVPIDISGMSFHLGARVDF